MGGLISEFDDHVIEIEQGLEIHLYHTRELLHSCYVPHNMHEICSQQPLHTFSF